MAGARGEGYIELGDERLAILFTNRALADVERLTSKSTLQLVNGFGRDSLGIGDIAQLLAAGLECARRENRSRPQSYTINDAYRLLDECGFGEIAPIVFKAIADVLAYSPKREAERDNPPA